MGRPVSSRDSPPSPHVFAVHRAPGVLEDAGRDGPENHGADEPANGEHGVVGRHLLRSPVTAAAVGQEDNDTTEKRDAGHNEDNNLRPEPSPFRPGW